MLHLPYMFFLTNVQLMNFHLIETFFLLYLKYTKHVGIIMYIQHKNTEFLETE